MESSFYITLFFLLAVCTYVLPYGFNKRRLTKLASLEADKTYYTIFKQNYSYQVTVEISIDDYQMFKKYITPYKPIMYEGNQCFMGDSNINIHFPEQSVSISGKFNSIQCGKADISKTTVSIEKAIILKTFKSNIPNIIALEIALSI
ncbi:hypothetical protein SAMN05216480_11830 [Pustulibacterium marinum]|uniref:Uncharacterized protein n=1 Tax=Pustulibacterium marinum TaxID=1224947 RepID=A0A1I7IN06_9FLAO|nr:hypothetical protein [Pustulibacterium marinum]SFU74325.1 hypothetical protein SAMN05216480_11830 [Pustulibacterium marinum]